MFKKILICLDSFKESIDSVELTEILSEFLNEFRLLKLPFADGGEGSLKVLHYYKPLEKRNKLVTAPYEGYVKAHYYVEPNTNEAYFELASISGLGNIPFKHRDPSSINTYGTGELILHAIKEGSKNINLFLGGSSSNDAGIGIAAALGVKFYSQGTQIHLPKGRDMLSIDKIRPTTNLDGVSINLLHDVNNPFVGARGAVNIYAKQKGANATMRNELEKGMENMAHIIQLNFGIDISSIEGAGAAGGIAGGLNAFVGGKMQSGFEFFSELTELKEKIKEVDLVITGEGRIDQQSKSTKLVSRICTLAKIFNKKIFTISGENTLSNEELDELGIIDSIELKQFGNKKMVNRENTLLELEACKHTFVKKIKQII